MKNIFRNSFFSLLSQLVVIVFGFFSQRVMFLQMGRELVGINGVTANIIAILSVSELGISTAVVYHLYRAIAMKQEQEIAALMNLYRRAYGVFACVVTLLGLCVMPFVHLFLKENSCPLSFVRLIYGMWLFRTVLSYLLSYKRSILIADQKEYLVSIVTLFINGLNYLSIIIIVSLTSNYVAALGVNIVIEVVWNVGLSRYVDVKYPFLKALRREPLPRNVVLQIASDVKNIFVTRLSSKLLCSTDNLIISGFISVGTVGLYSNYCLITQSVSNIVLALSNAVQPSIGSLFVEDSQEKNYRALRQLTFVFFILAVFTASSLLALMEPFIWDFWLGEGSLLDFSVVICCAINCYILTLGMPLAVMMGVTGLFEKERNLSVAVAAVNLILSLGLAGSFGIVGVLIGTGFAYGAQLVFRVRIFFRDYLQKNSGKYAAELLGYTCLAAVEMAVTFQAAELVYGAGGFWRFVLVMALCVLIPIGGNAVLFCRSRLFLQMLAMVRKK